ncbi:MAG: hypothetical protein AB7N76_22105 [Planctomycetota bacterium]
MSSGGAVYARVPAGGVVELEAAIRAARGGQRQRGPLGVLACEPGHLFALVDRWGRGDDMPRWSEGPDPRLAEELAALSRAVGQVVAFFEVDEGEELGLYGVWQDGELTRWLVWCDGGWCEVEGEPQSWEGGLFTPERRAEAIEEARDWGGDPAAVEAAYASGRLVTGASAPRAREMALLIRTALAAPPYGVQPWPRRREALQQLT